MSLMFLIPIMFKILLYIGLVALTLTFDLLFKKCNLGHNFKTGGARAFILHMCSPFTSFYNFWPSDLDLEVWPTFQKL